jgi:hypothetical protein
MVIQKRERHPLKYKRSPHILFKKVLKEIPKMAYFPFFSKSIFGILKMDKKNVQNQKPQHRI